MKNLWTRFKEWSFDRVMRLVNLVVLRFGFRLVPDRELVRARLEAVALVNYVDRSGSLDQPRRVNAKRRIEEYADRILNHVLEAESHVERPRERIVAMELVS